MEINTSFEHFTSEQLVVLENDTLDQIRKLSGVGQSHSINGRSVSLPDREKLMQCLADIRRAIRSQARVNNIAAQGGSYQGYHTSYAGFNNSNNNI